MRIEKFANRKSIGNLVSCLSFRSIIGRQSLSVNSVSKWNRIPILRVDLRMDRMRNRMFSFCAMTVVEGSYEHFVISCFSLNLWVVSSSRYEIGKQQSPSFCGAFSFWFSFPWHCVVRTVRIPNWCWNSLYDGTANPDSYRFFDFLFYPESHRYCYGSNVCRDIAISEAFSTCFDREAFYHFSNGTISKTYSISMFFVYFHSESMVIQ